MSQTFTPQIVVTAAAAVDLTKTQTGKRQREMVNTEMDESERGERTTTTTRDAHFKQKGVRAEHSLDCNQ